MVVQKEKRTKMFNYITNLFEHSGAEIIEREKDFKIRIIEPQLTLEPERSKLERTTDFFLHMKTTKDNIKDISKLVLENNLKGIASGHIFYKSENDEAYFVRLGAKAYFKSKGKTLKNYNREEIQRMINLRKLEEKYSLKIKTNNSKINKFILTYQPETERNQESIRIYRLDLVKSDNTHNSIASKFAGEERINKMMKLPVEVHRIYDEVKFLRNGLSAYLKSKE